MNGLFVCEKIAELKKEIADLRAKIVALIQEKEDLVHNVCPAVKADYYDKLGKLEGRIRMLELSVEELKFRISIIQAAINRREKLSEKTVEKRVEERYSEYRKRVEEAYENAEKENRAERAREKKKQENYDKYTGKSGIEDVIYRKLPYAQRVKELYRRLVKMLHPDINPNRTDREKELFFATQKAYGDSDLEKLEEIYEELIITSDELPLGFGSVSGGEGSLEDFEYLQKLREKLLEKLHKLEAEIEEIKSSFPYSAKAMLEDSKALSERQEKLNELIREYEDILAELKKIYDRLWREFTGPAAKAAGAGAAEAPGAKAAREAKPPEAAPAARPGSPATSQTCEQGNANKPNEPVEFWE